MGNTHYLFLEYADGGELFDRIGNWNNACTSNHIESISLVPRPHPKAERRVWYTLSVFLDLMT